ncbi:MULTISPECIES: SprT family zinc-dependent metalloprotease [Vibrio]|uniref:Protein SprT n=2 Tax=Vibrio TaxID=662 RepID=A0A7X4RTY4_9VIBR|nr:MULTISPECIES: SprT family zinc-dependent metalloprotease [Vibrio]MBF9001408.1 SprT family zinc-dependent metalloprotease [Vibrio nitrifigilis]MZI92677.1 SprT family zinc-dependent metalloprotease [Vibrio eleionomae]
MTQPTIGPDLTKQAQSVLQRCTEQANQYFSTALPTPSLSYKLRGKAAGKAYMHLNEVRLNPVLFNENKTAFLEQVIPHEVAHIVTYQLFGRVRPHGKEWQAVMTQVFHLAPDTTHQFSVLSVQGKTFEYACACQHHQLSIRRHNKIQRGQAVYRCQHCHQEIRFTGKRLS